MKKIYAATLIGLCALTAYFIFIPNKNKIDQGALVAKEKTETSQRAQSKSGPELTNLLSQPKKYSISRNPKPVTLPTGNLKEKLSSLELSAFNGKPSVAFSLSSEILNCLNLPQGDQNKSQNDPDITYAERCRGLNSDDYKAGIKLLEYAASQGDANAAYSYMGLMSIWMNHNPNTQFDENFISSFKTKTINYLTQSSANGNIDATSQLAYVYQNGIITNRDPVTAYAYMNTVNESGLIPGTQRILSIWQNNLSPTQLSAALDLSRKMHN